MTDQEHIKCAKCHKTIRQRFVVDPENTYDTFDEALEACYGTGKTVWFIPQPTNNPIINQYCCDKCGDKYKREQAKA